MWPGGVFGAKGRIPAGLLADEGRVVVYADAPEWRDALMAAFEVGATGVPDELRDGCIQTLVRWKGSWDSRPDCVVGLSAAGFDRLTDELSSQLAAVGRLPQKLWTPKALVIERQASGGEEAARWRETLGVEPDLRDFVDGSVVLLLVDRTASLWPVTVAAAALRRAGARAVLPLVVHRQP